MDLTLTRFYCCEDGIFGRLFRQDDGEMVAYTLEHAYSLGGGWEAKIPLGSYLCRRGMHRLMHMTDPFETFEITGVEGHTNLLFHAGNFNKDSEGCILVGDAVTGRGEDEMVTNSKVTFTQFMAIQTGVDSFTLQVNTLPENKMREV